MNSNSSFLALAILASSFWGSWHCAAMCGPIASLAARRNSLSFYNLGRGLSYVGAGALGGFLGSFFLASDFEVVRWVAGFIFAVILIAMGMQMFRGDASWVSPRWNFAHRLFAQNNSSFGMGLISIFLPCGWLYSYIMAAAASQSVRAGALTMFLFWIAGLPALSAISIFMKKSIQLAPQRKQIIAGAILTLAGVYSLFSFYFFAMHTH